MEQLFSLVMPDLAEIKNDVLSVVLTVLLIFTVIAGYYIIAGLLLGKSPSKIADGDEDDN